MKLPRNAQAQHAVDFISNLTLVGDYSGQPFVLRRFQEQIVRRLFGTLNRQGRRAITKSCWLLPRKCAKSTLAAAVLLYALFTFPPGQQIYSVARDREQSSEIFKIAAQMVRQDEWLSSQCEVHDSTRRITIPSRHSFYAALSREHKGNKLGKNPSVILFDEFQELDDKMHAAMITAMGSRAEPLVIYLGTAGERKEGIGWEITEYAKRVQAGIVEDETFLPCLWFADEADDWASEAIWKKCIPALGDFVSLDFIKNECEQAKHLPRLEADFKRFYLNIWQSPSHSWIKDADVMANALPQLHSPWHVAALDVASVNDTSSLVLFGENDDGTYDVKPYIWVCERQVRERSTAEAAYPLWQRQGHLRVTRGEAQDQQAIFPEILQICRQYHVKILGCDQWGMQWLGPKLIDEDINLVAVGQGMREISEPLKHLERLILHKRLRLGSPISPVLRWMFSNARVVKDHSENIRLDKRGAERMDAVQALAMCCALWHFDDEDGWADNRSVYEERGIIVV